MEGKLPKAVVAAVVLAVLYFATVPRLDGTLPRHPTRFSVPEITPFQCASGAKTLPFSWDPHPAPPGCQSIRPVPGAAKPAEFQCLHDTAAASEVIAAQTKKQLSLSSVCDNRKSGKRPKIALLQPITTRKLTISSVAELPPLAVWLCSMLQTVEPERFEYIMYYGELRALVAVGMLIRCKQPGYDAGDAWYDDPVRGPQFRAAVDAMIAAVGLNDTVAAKFVRLEGMKGKITSLWNALAAQAYADGCDYYVPSNDDLRILSPGWASLGTAMLAKSPLLPNLGLVYFNDLGALVLFDILMFTE